ncbi:MAG: catalase family peroxidase [Stellaceae bacterium]
MPNDPSTATPYRLRALAETGTVAKLAVIAAALLAAVGCFAYVGGWLSPHRLTQAEIIDTFEEVSGVHSGFRRNHAKGVCIGGYFESNGEGARLSKAAVFRPGRVPVIGRLSLAGGEPYLADGPAAIRSMALAFRPPDGEEWRMAMIDIPVFTVKDPESFWEQLLASRPDPKTGKPDPAKMKDFVSHHPETARALEVLKANPFSSGFANASYNALDAFRFVKAAGASTPVRWSMAAVEPFEPETAAQPATQDKNYLFDAVTARIGQGPLQWRLAVTVGQPGDPTDATLQWPSTREQVDVGMLTINHIEGEAPGNCRDVNFDPLVLPSGIEPSDDPLLSARSAAYSTSFTRRAGEKKEPSAVQIPAGGKGA